MMNCFGRTEYDYDVFGNLKRVVLPGNKIVDYKVDGYNRRIKKLVDNGIVEYYLWHDQLRLAAILDHNKQVKTKFIYAPDSRMATLIEKNNILYKVIHEPGLNSVRYIFNLQTKEVVQEIEYNEMGNQLKNTNPNFQPLGYAGGLLDVDTKLIRFGARDYDPTVGRWTTKDPMGFASGDPMSKTDPTGLIENSFCGAPPMRLIYLVLPKSRNGTRLESIKDEIKEKDAEQKEAELKCKDPRIIGRIKKEKSELLGELNALEAEASKLDNINLLDFVLQTDCSIKGPGI